MLEYIEKNKEWIFSGVGVLFISAISAFIWKAINRNKVLPSPQISVIHVNQEPEQSNDKSVIPALKSNEHITATPAPITRISAVSLSEIRRSVDAAPSLQKNQVANSYEGIHVEWDSKLLNAEMKDDDTVWLILIIGSPAGDMFHCSVKFSEYRELGILNKGARIRVSGRIKKVETLAVELDDVKLFFTDPVHGVSN